MNHGQSSNRQISVKENFSFFLGITLGHKSCLVLVNNTIRPKLHFEHPLATHGFALIGSFNYLSSSI
jgi:hypothetical protein